MTETKSRATRVLCVPRRLACARAGFGVSPGGADLCANSVQMPNSSPVVALAVCQLRNLGHSPTNRRQRIDRSDRHQVVHAREHLSHGQRLVRRLQDLVHESQQYPAHQSYPPLAVRYRFHGTDHRLARLPQEAATAV